jgi:hypothetical protein
MSSADIVRELADRIAARQRLYGAAYDADLAQLRATHGPDAISEALALIERKAQHDASPWDASGHTRRVRAGIQELLRRKAADPEGFEPGVTV